MNDALGRDGLRPSATGGKLKIIEHVWHDVTYAWRALLRSPGFGLIVTVILAIGIGANAAVISVIDSAYLRKIPVLAPERLVAFTSGDKRDPPTWPVSRGISFPDYRDLQSLVQGTDELAAYAMDWLRLGGDLAGLQVFGAFVTGNYFPLLGVRALRGRLIGSDEEEPQGAHPVVVISHTMWKSRFASDPGIVGRQLVIGRGRFTIIGVTHPRFTGLQPEGRTDLWLPYTMQAEATGENNFGNRDARRAGVVGRMSPGGTVARVQASLDVAALALADRYPQVDGSLRLRAMRQDHLVPIERAPMAAVSFMLVWAMVALLHLVACSNIATLMLARAASRRRELGIRLCLGASPGRVLTQSLAEPALLAVFGAVGGVVIARLLTQLITSMQFLSALDPGLDLRVVVIVALTAAATVLVFGWFPARAASGRDPLTVLQGTSGMRVAGRRGDATPFLIAGQVVVSLILLANAAVFARTFDRQSRGDPGFDTRHLAVVGVSLRSKDPYLHDWGRVDEMTARVAALPGVRQVAVSNGAPLYQPGSLEEVVVAGHDYAEGEGRRLWVQKVGPGYFSTAGAVMATGRDFTAMDRTYATPWQGFDVAVVNEAMARRYWPGADPIGRRVAFHGRGSATVIGVVRDMKDVVISSVTPRVYFPLLEWRMTPGFTLMVRTSGDPAAMRSLLTSSVTMSSLESDPSSFRTMEEILNDALSLSRIGGIALGLCGAIALLLTTIGLYGLVGSWAAERRHEIGIRLALGAQPWHIHRLLLGAVGALVGAGALIGSVAAIAVIRLEAGWWGPSIVLEATPLLVASLVLATVAGLAAYIPSRRATLMAPTEVLQSS